MVPPRSTASPPTSSAPCAAPPPPRAARRAAAAAGRGRSSRPTAASARRSGAASRWCRRGTRRGPAAPRRREDVDQAAADAELAVLVDRIGAGEAGVDETIGERRGSTSTSGLQHHGGVAHPVDAADARQIAARRGHDDARRVRRQRVQGARARRGHVEVRRDLAVRIDLERRAGKHDALGVGRAPASSVEAKKRMSAISGSMSRSAGRRPRTTGDRRAAARQRERHRRRRDPGQVLRAVGRARPVRCAPKSSARSDSDDAERDRAISGCRPFSCIRDTMRDVEIARHHLDPHDAPAPGLDHVPPDDRVMRPVRAFHEHVRLQSRDDRRPASPRRRSRRRPRTSSAASSFGALELREDRAAGPFSRRTERSVLTATISASPSARAAGR